MKFLLSVLFGCLFIFQLKAGVLQGRITDEKGDALPFANVFVRGTTNGTTANEQGFYQFRLEPGTYEMVFQY
ncbi:MAG TPA: carboxypeptidase-like regulatory domain-containing protein, partial [Adhaeribacter sp.]|nr:carboxypeptidase-like regulatory domain-containing protein [Adhaeribacter sp.]